MSEIIFPKLIKAKFKKRVNRFIAEVELNYEIIQVHVPSTGRMDGILEIDATCYLKPSTNPNRKTAYSLFIVEKDDIKVCIDSIITNDFAYELLRNGIFSELASYQTILREVPLEDERLDFVIYDDTLKKHLIEVKSVNKSDNNTACFPDAPTERGRKHLRNLIKYQLDSNTQSHIIFIVQRNDAYVFTPCKDRDPEFAKLLQLAYEAGVKIHVCLADVTEKGMYFNKWLPLIFN